MSRNAILGLAIFVLCTLASRQCSGAYQDIATPVKPPTIEERASRVLDPTGLLRSQLIDLTRGIAERFGPAPVQPVPADPLSEMSPRELFGLYRQQLREIETGGRPPTPGQVSKLMSVVHSLSQDTSQKGQELADLAHRGLADVPQLPAGIRISSLRLSGQEDYFKRDLAAAEQKFASAIALYESLDQSEQREAAFYASSLFYLAGLCKQDLDKTDESLEILQRLLDDPLLAAHVQVETKLNSLQRIAAQLDEQENFDRAAARWQEIRVLIEKDPSLRKQNFIKTMLNRLISLYRAGRIDQDQLLKALEEMQEKYGDQDLDDFDEVLIALVVAYSDRDDADKQLGLLEQLYRYYVTRHERGQSRLRLESRLQATAVQWIELAFAQGQREQAVKVYQEHQDRFKPPARWVHQLPEAFLEHVEQQSRRSVLDR